MKDCQCVEFLQWALPHMRMRWPGFRKVRRQVCKRIDRRIRELSLPDVSAYRDYLQRHADEWSVLDTFCRISISRFYRDRGVFEYLGSEMLRELAQAAVAAGDRQLECWSCGCASGEEVYTLKIVWRLCVEPRFGDLPLAITATDADALLLACAVRGCYSPGSLKDLPEAWRDIAFDRRDNLHCIRDEFRDGIRFLEQDVRVEQPAGPFHLILCRHLIFTYFDEPLQIELLGRLVDRLLPGGLLVTGKQEPLPCVHPQLAVSRPRMGVYRRAALGE